MTSLSEPLPEFITPSSATKVFVEFFATSILVFVSIFIPANFVRGFLEVNGDLITPIIVGLCVGTLINSFGHISGAQVNPAVSAGFVIVGDLKLLLFLFYVLAQYAGATFGAGIARLLLSEEMYKSGQGGMLIIREQDLTKAFCLEYVISLILYLHIILSSLDQPSNKLHPYTVGFTVAYNSYAASRLSGGCMNPARAVGATLAATGFDFGDDGVLYSQSWFSNAWFTIANPLGTISAALLYRTILARNPTYNFASKFDRNFFKSFNKFVQTP